MSNYHEIAKRMNFNPLSAYEEQDRVIEASREGFVNFEPLNKGEREASLAWTVTLCCSLAYLFGRPILGYVFGF